MELWISFVTAYSLYWLEWYNTICRFGFSFFSTLESKMIHTIVVRTTHRTHDIQLVAFFPISLFLFFGFLYSSFILISKVYKITLLVGTTEKTAISMFGWIYIYIYFRLKAYTHKNWVFFLSLCKCHGGKSSFFSLDNQFFCFCRQLERMKNHRSSQNKIQGKKA